MGIKADAVAKIFDAFDQGDDGVTRRFGGLGLGLPISRSLAEAHGGSLAATSPGEGREATFTLRLPTIGAEPGAPAAWAIPGPDPIPQDPGRAGRSLRIQMVEDNADTLRIMARLLRGRGHVVTPADSVAGALTLAAEADYAFDLDISDLGLPDGSGTDLLRAIAARRPIAGTALTGFGMADDVRKSCEAGFAEHLNKPVDFPALEDAIARVVAAG